MAEAAAKTAAPSAGTIHFELVSPERKLVSEPVRMAVVPGEEGEVGAGAGHMSLMVSLKPGVVKLYKDAGSAPEQIFITGGFADITAQMCTVLAEEAVNVNDLSAEDAEQALRDLQEDLGMASDKAARRRITTAIEIAKARLQAVTGKLQL